MSRASCPRSFSLTRVARRGYRLESTLLKANRYAENARGEGVGTQGVSHPGSNGRRRAAVSPFFRLPEAPPHLVPPPAFPPRGSTSRRPPARRDPRVSA